ncbi:hypothetical protein FHS96_000961 [Sphingomonas zeicaulis]|uniref:hypothetical protein n=1 Tax=Sphingomonas zeicaulis TaxID=1632740 RepID=UPI003D23A591
MSWRNEIGSEDLLVTRRRGDVSDYGRSAPMTGQAIGSASRAEDVSYFDQRIAACVRAADLARDGCARRVHLDLAERYRRRREALLGND